MKYRKNSIRERAKKVPVEIKAAVNYADSIFYEHFEKDIVSAFLAGVKWREENPIKIK